METHDFNQAYTGINSGDSLQNILMRAFESTNNGIMVVDASTTIIAINPAFTRITGYEPEEVIGKRPNILNSGRQERDFYESMWSSLENSGHWEGEIWNRRKNGEIYPEWLNIASVNNKNGDLQYYVGMFSDISAIKSVEDKLIELAFYDPLTSLPNRSLFNDRLNQALAHARRENGHFAVLFIDLDGFKEINDRHGHLAGDAVLLETAGRLSECIRTSDTVARLGGDEFIIIAENINGISDVARVARNVLETMAQDYEIKGKRVSCGASIGIAVYPESGNDAETLVKNADMAMYEAKEAGKNGFRFHASTKLRQKRQRLRTVNRKTYPPADDLRLKKSGT